MLQNGTLRKRTRVNLAKVNGLTTIPYNESLDTFKGFFESRNVNVNGIIGQDVMKISKEYTTLRLSSAEMAEYRRNSLKASHPRITRDPSLHSIQNLKNIDIERQDHQYKNPTVLIKRDRFLKNSTIFVLKLIVYFGTMFGTVPWKWNDKKQKIERRSPRFEKFWRWQLHIGSVQTAIIFYIQLNAFLQKLYSNQTSNRRAFMGTFGFVWSGMVLGKNWNMYLYAEKIRIYLNALLEFNKRHVKTYVIHLDDYQYRGGIVLHPLFFYFALIQISVSVSLFVRMPFQPWYLFSYIYPKPWYWLIPGAFHEFLMVGQAITFVVMIPWTIVAHTNTLRFWLRELHNDNESGYTAGNLRTPQNALRTYKSLNVLNILFNECMAPVAIPVMLLIWAATLVPCGYVMVRSMNHMFIDDFPGILSFPVAIFSVFIKVLFVSSLSAEVSDLGSSFLHSWSQTKQKDFRRILMSCSTLKIWTGRFYYFTASTTVTFFMRVFGSITDCVITFP